MYETVCLWLWRLKRNKNMFDLVRLFCLQGTKVHLEHLKNKRGYWPWWSCTWTWKVVSVWSVAVCLPSPHGLALSVSPFPRSCPRYHSSGALLPFLFLHLLLSLPLLPSLPASFLFSLSCLFPSLPFLSLPVSSLPFSLGSPLSAPSTHLLCMCLCFLTTWFIIFKDFCVCLFSPFLA